MLTIPAMLVALAIIVTVLTVAALHVEDMEACGYAHEKRMAKKRAEQRAKRRARRARRA